MDERQITVVIPTYNRFDCMKYFFENCFSQYTGKLFTFEVHDSSDDDRLQKYIEDNYADSPILKYFRYDPSINGDIKTINAIWKVKTTHTYLLGDGKAVKFNDLEEFLKEYEYNKYSVITFKYSGHGGLQRYENCAEFCHENFTFMTNYGHTIVKNEMMRTSSTVAEKYMRFNSPFIYICSIFEGLYRLPGLCLATPTDALTANPLKTGSGWMIEKREIEFFCYKYYKSIELLPDYFEPIKFLAKLHNRQSKLFSFKNSMRARASKNITLSLIKKYHYYIRKTVPHVIPMYLSLIFPPKLLYRFYVKRDGRKILKEPRTKQS